MKIYKGSLIKLKETLRNGLYFLQGCTAIDSVNVVTDPKSKQVSLWHKRLAHVSERGLLELQKQGLFGKEKVEDLPFCVHCILGKATKVRFNKAEHCIEGILDYIHSYLWESSTCCNTRRG